MRRVVCVALFAAAVVSAGVSATSLSDCDPLVPDLCMLPFPNNFWLRGSPPSTNFSDHVFPTDSTNGTIRAGYGGWNGRDGFSPMGPVMTYLPDLSLDDTPRLWNISTSLSAHSHWMLLDTVTGKRVAFWAELDHVSDPDEPQRALIMWPAARLASGRRYIVAGYRLVTTSNTPVKPSAAFAALRDNTTSNDPDVNLRRALFQDIFDHLAKAGIPRSELQTAWDFTTASQAQNTGKMVSMRDDALKRFPSTGPVYVIDKVTDYNATSSPDIAREVQGHFMVPWYLNHPGLIPGVDSRLVVDDDGVPVFQDFQPVNFTIRVPWVVTTANHTPAYIVQYGHGLFGDQSEVRAGYLGQESNKYGYVMGAVDWLGLSAYDEATVALMLSTDVSNFAMVPDRCHQGMLDALAFMRLMMSDKFATDPVFMYHGVQAFQTKDRFYYGNSQGGILGTVYMSLTQDVSRGTIGVGGGPYALLLPRSSDFSALQDVLKLRYFEPLKRASLFAVFQLLWDDLEPAGYVDAISENLLPGTPAHRVIFHHGLADAQVTWLGVHVLARSTHSVMYESNVHEGNETLALFPKVADTDVVTSGNVIMTFDFGAPVVPFINIPPNKKYDTHEKPRRTAAAQEQMHTFFTTGNVVNTCKGACVNESDPSMVMQDFTATIPVLERSHRVVW